MPEEKIDKLPPQSIEAEKSVLGCLLLDKDAIIRVVDFLKEDDFYKGAHKEIYLACLELFQKGEPIDILSVANRLREKNLLEDVGGMSYLSELVNLVPTPKHVVNYAQIVHRKRLLRDLISASQEIAALAYNETDDIDVILDKAERKIFSIAQKSLNQTLVPICETLEETIERIERLTKQEKGLRGISTGFRDLDRILAGLQKSDLIILASRPTFGKSAIALNMATHCAINERLPVAFFSLEMSRDQIVDRLISSLSGVDLWRLRTGFLNLEEKEEFERVQRAIEILAETPLYICDEGAITVLQMKAMCRRLQAEKGLGLVILDYLQLLTPLNPNASPVQQVSENSRALKVMAKELNCPILVISQLSRAVEHRSPPIPRLADLRMSGTIEQDADVVLFLYREDRYRPDTERKNIADLIIAKHRNGPVGRVELYFDENTVTFRDLEREFLETD